MAILFDDVEEHKQVDNGNGGLDNYTYPPEMQLFWSPWLHNLPRNAHICLPILVVYGSSHIHQYSTNGG